MHLFIKMEYRSILDFIYKKCLNDKLTLRVALDMEFAKMVFAFATNNMRVLTAPENSAPTTAKGTENATRALASVSLAGKELIAAKNYAKMTATKTAFVKTASASVRRVLEENSVS